MKLILSTKVVRNLYAFTMVEHTCLEKITQSSTVYLMLLHSNLNECLSKRVFVRFRHFALLILKPNLKTNLLG